MEAEAEARKALLAALQAYGRYAPHTAEVLTTMVRILFEQARYAEAETLARANLDIYQRTGADAGSFRLAAARSLLADSLVGQGRWQEALGVYESIAAALSGERALYERVLAGNVHHAAALLRAGEAERALALLEPAHARSVERLGATHYASAEFQAFVAMSRAALGGWY